MTLIDDQEWEFKLQFIEEAQDYLNTLESGLLGLSASGNDGKRLDGMLRSAHSIKGGAAMMGFQQLSDLSHRLEDSFKVLKVGKTKIDGELEHLLLASVDRLRQVVELNSKRRNPEPDWLETEANPIFDGLHAILGDPQPEDAAALLAADMGEDMSTLLFQTEIDESLNKLEAIIADPNRPNLEEELQATALEFTGVGAMIELEAFSDLSNSVVELLAIQPDRLEAIARTAISQWRRCQALVLVGQTQLIPNYLELDEELATQSIATNNSKLDFSADLDDLPEFADFAEVQRGSQDGYESIVFGLEEYRSVSNHQEFSVANATLSAEESEIAATLEELEIINVNHPELISSVIFEEAAQDLFSSIDQIMATQNVVVSEVKSVVAPTPVTPAKPIATARSESEANDETADNTIRVSVQQLEQLSELFGEITIERNALDLQLKNLRGLIGNMTQKVKKLEQSNAQLRVAYDRISTTANYSKPIPNKERLQPVAAGYSNDNGNDNGNRIDRQPKTPDFIPLNLGSEYSKDFDSLEMDRYSDIHLLSQEVMESVVQIQEVSKDVEVHIDEVGKTSRDLTRTSKRMQTSITQVRMRPFSDLLSRFPRALRDMALKYGKQVELKTKGGSTLLERTVIEVLNEPLLHLFRNAFDHGIETPDKRIAKGKRATGTIEITAAYRGNQTEITIKDDGGGIPIDKIKQRAIQMGLDESDLAKAAEKDLLDLIFEPGFSTADKVTDLSGRGVGMDVVRTKLREVRGEITVETFPDRGTTFTITIPMNLSIVRILIVESNGLFLGFPANTIEEMIPFDNKQVIVRQGRETIDWEGVNIPLIRLGQLMQFSYPIPTRDMETIPIINEANLLIVGEGKEMKALQVDRYWREEEVTIRQVEGVMKLPQGLTGCTILGDGRVIPLVDAIALLASVDRSGSLLSPKQEVLNKLAFPISRSYDTALFPNNSLVVKHTVMIVDDSITVRRFLAKTLEKAGYRVEQAKDGQDALEKIQAGIAVEAIVCDIEMPRMDGFGFLSHVKSSNKNKNLPIIMLTSRIGAKHRQLATNLGANAYFSKPFQERELLGMLDRLI
jgi:two-component system, chemotaxis family, sensor histidine kinase and response regulator PixL